MSINSPIIFIHHCILESIPTTILQDCRHTLNQKELSQLQHLKSPKVQNRFLLSRCLLRHLLSKHADALPHEWQFIKNIHGKPQLAPLQNQKYFAGNLHFNLSHSGNWIALAIANSSVGLDIQKIKTQTPVLKIAQRFFHELETQKLKSIAKLEQHQFFFQLWTLKEAYLKNLGIGISGGMKTFCLTHKNHEINLHKKLTLQTWLLEKQYLLSMALSENMTSPLTIAIVHCNHLAIITPSQPNLTLL